MNNLANGSTPELRVVASAFAPEGAFVERRVNSEIVLPVSMRAAADRAFVQRGVEALARYSSSKMDQSSTPWQEGFSTDADRDRGVRVISVTVMPATSADGTSLPGVATLEAHEGIVWNAPTQHSSAQTIQSIGETTNISIIRTLIRVANPVLEMADGLRALRMNQIRMGDGLTLKLDGRTGRHARCFAILTQRF